MRNRLIVLLAAFVLSCSGGTSTLRLRIAADPAVDALDALVALARTGTGDAAHVSDPVEWNVTGRDLVADPLLAEIEIPKDSAFSGEALLVIQGQRNGVFVATAVMQTGLDATGTVDLLLVPLAPTCDADGDGFRDCTKDGCCKDDESDGFADCDDSQVGATPFAKKPECRCPDGAAVGTAACIEAGAEADAEVVEADDPDDESYDVPLPEVSDALDAAHTENIDGFNDVDAIDVCMPECAGKECGDDGCGGSCGTADVPACERQEGVCSGVTKDAALCVEGVWLACDDLYYAEKAAAYEPSPEASIDGLDNDCDGWTDENFDFDHDGVCEGCAGLNALDTCPTVWNPDNDASLCPAIGEGFAASRTLTLSEPGSADGTSTWRRTNEPVEIPLWNGILDDSVVGYWKLDGGLANDESGHGNTGTIVGATATTGFRDDVDGAMSFDGSKNSISIDGLWNNEWCASGTSASAWVKTNAVSAVPQVVALASQGAGTDYDYWSLHVTPQGKAAFDWDRTIGTDVAAVSTTTITDGSWHLLVGTINGDTLAIYVDGRLETTFVGDGLAPCFTPGVEGRTRFGYNAATEPDAFDGVLDEVLLFNRALAPTEIAAYYKSRKPYGTSLVPGAQADFDDVRVTEAAPATSGAENAHTVPVEILGPRPHSDSQCPMETDDGSWKDRDDLCGVVGYWKLDGSASDSSGSGNHLSNAQQSFYAKGRFGDTDGSLKATTVGATETVNLGIGAFTVEAWVFPQVDPIGGNIVKKGGWISVNYHLWVPAGVPTCTFNRPDGNHSACASTSSLPLGTWSHVACSYDGATIIVYVDGVVIAACPDTNLLVTGDSSIVLGPSSQEPMALDDVLVHSVAKSPDYIYRRARLGVPTARFLAHTESGADSDGRFPWLNYDLHWGNAAADAVAPVLTALDHVTKSVGLLSPAIGYAGWWRFNEGSGTVAYDEAQRHLRADLFGDAVWIASSDGTAWSGDGNDFLTVAHDPSLDLFTFAAEAIVLPDSLAATAYRVVVTKGIVGSTFAVPYYLAVKPTGEPYGLFEDAEDENYSVSGTTFASDGEWTHVAMTFDGASLKTFSGFAEDGLLSTTAVPAQTTYDLVIGASRRPAAGSWQEFFIGAIDSVRLMSRALTPDEFLHYPMAAWSAGSCYANGNLDSDNDLDPDATDCAPTDPTIHHGSTETCNGKDDDCDGETDETCDDLIAGVYDVVTELDLMTPQPENVQATIGSQIEFLARPSTSLLLLICAIENATLQDMCGYVFTTPEAPDVTQLATVGEIVLELIDAYLAAFVEEWTGTDIIGIGDDVRDLIRQLTLIATYDINAEPDENGNIAASDTSASWHSVTFRWTYGLDCQPNDDACGRIVFNIQSIGQNPITATFPATVSTAAGYLELGIGEHSLNLHYGALLNYILQKVVLPRVFGDGSDGLPVVDSYEKLIKSLLGGCKECLNPAAGQKTCCQTFTDNVIAKAGDAIPATLLSNACESLITLGAIAKVSKPADGGFLDDGLETGHSSSRSVATRRRQVQLDKPISAPEGKGSSSTMCGRSNEAVLRGGFSISGPPIPRTPFVASSSGAHAQRSTLSKAGGRNPYPPARPRS